MGPEDALLFVDGIVEADLRGISTHGIYRLPVYARGFRTGAINPRPTLSVLRERAATMLVDADNGLGVVVGQRAMDLAVGLARASGLGAVGVRNSNHSGMLAVHVLRAAGQDMIGQFLSNTPALMAPHGGRESVMSNSPMAWAIPTSTWPIVLDMATSAVARGRIRLAAQRNERIPSGWAVDRDGYPAEDAHAAMTGTVLPMAGHKGYGLALVNEILAAALPGARLGFDVPRGFLAEGAQSLDSWGIGHLAIAISIDAFGDVDSFKAAVDRYRNAIVSSRRAAGTDRIFVPGEMEHGYRENAISTGLRIPADVLRSLDALAEELDIEPLRAVA